MSIEMTPEISSAEAAARTMQDDRHAYVVVTTVEGHQQCIHAGPEAIDEAFKLLSEQGQSAMVTFPNLDTDESYWFPGNIAIVRSFSAARFSALNSEADAARKAATEEAQKARVLIPGRRA